MRDQQEAGQRPARAREPVPLSYGIVAFKAMDLDGEALAQVAAQQSGAGDDAMRELLRQRRAAAQAGARRHEPGAVHASSTGGARGEVEMNLSRRCVTARRRRSVERHRVRVDVSKLARESLPFDGRRLFTVIGLFIVAAPHPHQ